MLIGCVLFELSDRGRRGCRQVRQAGLVRLHHPVRLRVVQGPGNEAAIPASVCSWQGRFAGRQVLCGTVSTQA